MAHPVIEEVGKGCFYAPDGTNVSLSFELKFPSSKNEAEYDALVKGSPLPYKWEITGFGCKEIPSSLLNRSTEN